MFRLRKAETRDLEAVRDIFRTTVLAINIRDYTQEQVTLWAARASDQKIWKEKIVKQYFMVAESEEGIAGFSSVTYEGYLDFLYVHKDFQRKGVGRLLMQEMLDFAERSGLGKVTSEVSITAKSFFERSEFVVEVPQWKYIGDVAFRNYLMCRRM